MQQQQSARHLEWIRFVAILAACMLASSLAVGAEEASSQTEPADRQLTLIAPPLRIVVPAYNSLARKASIQGWVDLEFVVSPDGNVQDVSVRKGLPFGLTDACADAVRHWVFPPPHAEANSKIRCDFRILPYDHSSTRFIEPQFADPQHLKIFGWSPFESTNYVMRSEPTRTRWLRRKKTKYVCRSESVWVVPEMTESVVWMTLQPDGSYEVQDSIDEKG